MNKTNDELISLLQAFITLSPKSMRALGAEINWRHTNMWSSLNGDRTFPSSRVQPLLLGLGLSPRAKPFPCFPWYAIWKPNTDAATVRTGLSHFFPDGGFARELTTSGTRAAATLMASNLCYTLSGDRAGTESVVLAVKLPFGNGDGRRAEMSAMLSDLGIERLPRRNVDPGEYRNLVSGSPDLSVMKHASMDEAAPGPSWDDVIRLAEERYGLSPSDMLSMLAGNRSEAMQDSDQDPDARGMDEDIQPGHEGPDAGSRKP